MRRIILSLLASATALGLASAASAADLARPAYKAPPPPPPIFSWTGFYIGVNVGAGWGTKEYEQQVPLGQILGGLPTLISDGSHTVNGALAGGQVGFNYQVGPTVWGVEVQADWANLRGKSNCGLIALWNCDTKVDGLATFAGRFGLTSNQTLVYVKGGAAWAHDKYNINLLGLNIPGIVQPSEIQDNRWGWMIGTGVEQAIFGGWSAKVEYNYMDFGNKDYRFNAVPGLNGTIAAGLLDHFNVTERIHLIKFGVNYRFGYAGSGVANY
jgi:outer membrane immunogenic protein